MTRAQLLMNQAVRDTRLDADLSSRCLSFYKRVRKVNFWDFRDWCLKLAKIEEKHGRDI